MPRRRAIVARARPCASMSRANASMCARRTSNRRIPAVVTHAAYRRRSRGVGLAGETGVAGLEPREGEGFRVGEQIIITGADQHPSRSGHDRTSKR